MKWIEYKALKEGKVAIRVVSKEHSIYYVIVSGTAYEYLRKNGYKNIVLSKTKLNKVTTLPIIYIRKKILFLFYVRKLLIKELRLAGIDSDCSIYKVKAR